MKIAVKNINDFKSSIYKIATALQNDKFEIKMQLSKHKNYIVAKRFVRNKICFSYNNNLMHIEIEQEDILWRSLYYKIMSLLDNDGYSNPLLETFMLTANLRKKDYEAIEEIVTSFCGKTESEVK